MKKRIEEIYRTLDDLILEIAYIENDLKEYEKRISLIEDYISNTSNIY